MPVVEPTKYNSHLRMSVSSILYSTIVFLFLGCLVPLKANAADRFSTQLESTYTIGKNGTVHVKAQFSLANSTSTTYATHYALEVGSNTVSNISVISNGSTLKPTTTSQSNKTTIQIEFPDKIVGKDQIRTFVVEYDTTDLATVTSKTLEVNIPKLARSQEFSRYAVHLIVDEHYQTPSVAFPKDFTTRSENGRLIVSFPNAPQDRGISVIFGEQQNAKVTLSYILTNPTNTKGTMSVTLPPDTRYQRVFIDSIQPTPVSITSDADGNWMANYELASGEQLSIAATVYVNLRLTSQEHAKFTTKRPGSEYLKAQPYWQVNDHAIQKLAKELKTADAIYSYVVKNLVYDYKRLSDSNERYGASRVLVQPNQALCQEFTDLFVSLSRAAGIPARAVIGYAYTQNESLRPLSLVRDVLHSWPEYWDETTEQWIAVDPTWEHTTGGVDYFSRMDFSHIAFAIQGVSSQFPLAAGMYTTPTQDGKQIHVEFIDSIPSYTQTFSSDLHLSPSSLFGLQNTYRLRLTNTSLSAVYAVPTTIRVQNTAGSLELSDKVTLAPLGSIDIPIALPRNDILSTYATTVNVRVQNQSFDHAITVQSTLQENLPLLLVTLVVATILGIAAFITWRLLVPRRKR